MYSVIEDTPYAGLIQHHLRIGDTFCFVPPTSIQIGHAMKNNKSYTLRARHPQVEESGFVERSIVINLFFANLDAINNEFRPILAQIRKCPFLPVENVYLNEVHGIHSIVIKDVTFSNVEGFPHCLQVQVLAAPFNAEYVFNDPLGRRYDEMIDWEKFRWYYKQSLDTEKKYAYINHYEMLYEELNDDFTFYVASEDSLEGIREWRKKKVQILYGRENEKARRTREFLKSFTSDSEEYQDFMERYKEHAAGIIKYEEIDYTPYEFPGLILTGFSYGLSNNIVSVPTQMQEDPMHQFMGAQDMRVVLEMQTRDMDTVAHMNAMLLKNQYLLREYHAEMPYGLLKLDTQMTRLLGGQHLAVEDVQFVASNEHTGIYTIQLVGTLFKKQDRKATEMSWINAPDSPFNKAGEDGKAVFDWDINRYANQSILGRIIPDLRRDAPWAKDGSYIDQLEQAGFSDRNIFEDAAYLGSETAEKVWNLMPTTRAWFAMNDTPFTRKMKTSFETIFKGYSDVDSFDKKKSLEFEHYIKESMAAYEMYPDLELPTWVEYSEAFGVDLPEDHGVFVEPDFFINYADESLYISDVIKYLMNESNEYSTEASEQAKQTITVLEDPFGGTVEYNVGKQDFGEITGYSEDFNDLDERAAGIDKKVKDYAAEESKPDAQSLIIDKNAQVNLETDTAEAYIREQAAQHASLTPEFALAFAKTDNKELMQYFRNGMNKSLDNRIVLGDDFIVGFQTIDTLLKRSRLPIVGTSEYTRSEKGNASLIGIMKVPTTENAQTPAEAIYYPTENIRIGMIQLAKSVDTVVNLMNVGDKDANIDFARKYFEEEHNLEFKQDSHVKFALATMHHAGEQKVVEMLLTKKKPEKVNENVINFANRVRLEMLTESKETWTAEDLKAKVVDLKIPDIKYEEAAAAATEEKVKGEGITVQELNIQKTAFADMIQHDKRGRLVRCFPTMMGMFIDEGRYLDSVKLADNFFNYQAFQSIMYVNNRKDASSTCYIELNNINQNLTDASKNADVQESSIWQLLQSFTGSGELAYIQQRSRDSENYDTMKSVSLTTGTRFHLRMGYGSDGRTLPTIMNGTITSIQNDGPIMTLIIQDDGIELSGKLKAKPTDTSDKGWFSNKDEPTQIVDYILADEGSFWHNTKRRFSDTAFREHSAGIRHFGLNDDMYDFRRVTSSLWGMGGGTIGGAATGLIVGGPIGMGIGALTGLLGGTVVGRSLLWNPINRKITEVNMNIHPHNGMNQSDYADRSNFDKAKELFGFGPTNESNINIGFYDKSVWDVLNICAAVDNDHIVAVHPFDFRSTIFSGRPTYPLQSGYLFDPEIANQEGVGADQGSLEKFLKTKTKQFKQLRIYDSSSTIISNSMMCSEKNIYNVATPIYLNEGEITSAPALYVDKNIYTDRQKHVNIDTTLNAKGFWGVDSIPLIGDWLNKPAEYLYDEGVAVRIASAGLRDFMKDMYDGYITVVGDPSTKPYDSAWINDDYLKIHGAVDIKEVVHIMDYESGFITMVKPDLITVNRDLRQPMTTMGMMTGAISALAGGYLLRRTIARKLKLNPKSHLGHLMWAMTKGAFNINKKALVGGFNLGSTLFDKVTGKKISPTERIARNQARQEKYDADTLLKAFRSDESLVKKYWNIGADKIAEFTKSLGSKSLRLPDAARRLRIGTGGASQSKVLGILKKVKNLASVARITPVGILLTVAEVGLYFLGGSLIRENLMRSTYYENACYVVPVRRAHVPWVSGMQGAGASVLGRPHKETLKQRFLSLGVIDGLSKFFLGFSTAEASNPLAGFEGIDESWFAQSKEDIEEREEAKRIVQQSRDYFNYVTPKIQAFMREDEHPTLEKMNVWIADASADYAIDIALPRPKDKEASVDYSIELYKERQMRVFDQLEKRINFPYEKLKRTIEDIDYSTADGGNILETLKEKVSNLFSSLFGALSGTNGINSGGSCGADGVTLDGKFEVSHSTSKQNFDFLSPMIEAEAKRQGAERYVELLKAITMQESSGDYKRTPDVMQSSESIDGNLGNIAGVEHSIRQGIKHWLSCVQAAKGDLTIALQCYNFGKGFAKYALERGGYSEKTASDFSDMWRAKKGWKRYGDKQYVQHVLKYYKGELGTVECDVNSMTDTGFAADCPIMVKANSGVYNSNLDKNRTMSTSGMVLLNASTLPKNVTTPLGGPKSTGGKLYLRKGAYNTLLKVAKEWETIMPGDNIEITSAFRPGDEHYHSTGWGMDIDVVNSVKRNGRWYGPSKAVSDRSEKLIRLFLKHGYRSIYLADDSIVPKLAKEYGDKDGYGGWMVRTENKNHWHHIHVSYPICK